MKKCKCGSELNTKGECKNKNTCIVTINNELKENTSLHQKERRKLAREIKKKREEK